MTVAKKIQIGDEPVYNVHQICLILKLNKNSIDYMVRNHPDKNLTERDWMVQLKKDGLTV